MRKLRFFYFLKFSRNFKSLKYDFNVFENSNNVLFYFKNPFLAFLCDCAMWYQQRNGLLMAATFLSQKNIKYEREKAHYPFMNANT